MKNYLLFILFFVVSCSGQTKETIPLIKQPESQIMYVKCTLNDVIVVPMILDTGCSVTTIPAHVAFTLVDTGTLGAEDLLERRSFRLADGSVIENQKIRLHSLKIGGQTFKDITVCVTKGGAPLLLGGDILAQLNSVTIDYINNTLTIEKQ